MVAVVEAAQICLLSMVIAQFVEERVRFEFDWETEQQHYGKQKGHITKKI